jgi:hypothetical protein
MGMACGVHVKLGELECQCTSKYGEYDWLLGCLQVGYTDAKADGDGNGDDEQQV